MKFEVDLDDIFVSNEGESVTDTIRDAVIKSLSVKVERAIAQEITDSIHALIPKKVSEMLDSLVPQILDYEITETSDYGVKKQPVTVRNKILSDFATAMKWRDGNYDSDRSVYTKVIRSVIEKKLSEFAKEFHREIDFKFLSSCIAYAQKELEKKLGIKS